MVSEWRVLPPSPFATLTAAVDAGAERGLLEAARIGPASVIDVLLAAGLRGRGGAGFPTGRKWRTVAANASEAAPTTVVVNAAEGEPGSFKDRMILRRDPYRVLEGALIAAFAVGADRVIVAMKGSFRQEVQRMRAAVEEVGRYGWTDDVEIDVFEGPTEYLYGEETALLEAIDGRAPFPRIAPPYRRGVDEIVETAGDVDTGSKSPAHVEMATATHDTPAPPTLVDNVETLANVARIVADGADWFRAVGTEQSPGTVVCTVSGRTQRHGVAEIAMGTPLREVIETIGGGADRRSRARGCPVRRRQRARPRRAVRHADQLRGDGRDRHRARDRRLHRVRRRDRSRRRRARAWPGSSRSSRAGSARRASRTA